jgi:BlaI family transcriptional regulator, penicillinase repressor
MSQPLSAGLSKRERQIMEVLYLLRGGAVTDVRAALADPPSYSAVRTTMNILVRKGFLSTRSEGRRYLYSPVLPHEAARRAAVSHLLKTYFDGSVREAVMGLIDAHGGGLDEKDFRELTATIRKARRRKA